jgi:hypothetical protein
VEASARRRYDRGTSLPGISSFAFLNRSFTERLPIAAGRMLGSDPKEVAMVLDEQLLTAMVLWSWVVFVLWATPPNYE